MGSKILIIFNLLILLHLPDPGSKRSIRHQTTKFLRTEIITRADKVLYEKPVTIIAFTCDRSAGGIHDFYSEGDYWWPDPENPDGPYIQRDGMSNPGNFTEHRKAMIRLSQVTGLMASAYKITGDVKYVKQAFLHLKAWFADTATGYDKLNN